MAAVWGGPVAWRCRVPVPADVQATARRLAGEVIENAKRLGHAYAFRQFRLDGVAIDVTMTAPEQPPIIAVRLEGRSPLVPRTLPRPAVWVPRGFVVLPASDSAPLGWGLPAIPAHTDPFNGANLRPGIEPNRWTPNGPCGQVLLTRVPDAGYTGISVSAMTSPLLFDHDHGPRPRQDDDDRFVIRLPPADAAWAAYRMEFEAFRANAPDLTDEQRQVVAAEKRALFEGINELREGAGTPPLTPPVRGWYDSAQATAAECVAVSVLGHYSDAFTLGWRTPDDRLGRDGIGAIASPAAATDRNVTLTGREAVAANTATEPVVIGLDPDGQPILDITGGGAPMTGAHAAALIEADPFALAQMTADAHAHACVGLQDNVAVVHAVTRDAWIPAGNRQWHPADPELPILTWFGADGLNLEGETYPITSTPVPTSSDPATQAGLFASWNPHTLTESSLLDDGFFWFRFVTPSASVAAEHWPVRPMFEQRIFARGRCIALAPGLVWAAAIRRRSDGTPELVALCHHYDDEPETPSERRERGFTSIVRLWRCAIADVAELGVNPEAVIRGVRGAAASWPWDDPASPYTWTGGEAIDVGTTDGSVRDLLAYASQWTFSPDGNAAVCCRVWGKYPECWRTLRVGGYGAEQDAYAWNTWGHGVIFGPTPRPGVMRLDLTDEDATPDWLGFNATATPVWPPGGEPGVRPLEQIEPGGIFERMTESHGTVVLTTDLVAAGWTRQGTLRFCVAGWTHNAYADPVDWSATDNNQTFYYAFIDDLAATTEQWRASAIEYGCVARKEGRGFLPVVSPYRGLQVLSMDRKAVIAYGTVPRFHARETAHQSPDYSHCWRDNPQGFFGVNAWVDGTRVAGGWYANPDNLVVNNLYLCYVGGVNGAPGPLAANRLILEPSFAVGPSGWVLSYTLRAQSGAVHAPSVSGDCPRYYVATPWGEVVYQDACTPRPSDLQPFDYGTGVLIGANAVASFSDDPVRMTAATGPRPHFLYARAV